MYFNRNYVKWDKRPCLSLYPERLLSFSLTTKYEGKDYSGLTFSKYIFRGFPHSRLLVIYTMKSGLAYFNFLFYPNILSDGNRVPVFYILLQGYIFPIIYKYPYLRMLYYPRATPRYKNTAYIPTTVLISALLESILWSSIQLIQSSIDAVFIPVFSTN